MTPVTLLSLKAMESLQNWLQPHSGATPSFSIIEVSQRHCSGDAVLMLTLSVNGPKGSHNLSSHFLRTLVKANRITIIYYLIYNALISIKTLRFHFLTPPPLLCVKNINLPSPWRWRRCSRLCACVWPTRLGPGSARVPGSRSFLWADPS